MLTNQQKQHYRDDGWLVPDYRVGESALAEMRTRAAALVERKPELRDLAPGLIVEAPVFLDFGCDPGLLDILEAVMGPNIILWGASIFGKPAGDGKRTPWHQDGQYWPIRPLATVTVWMALDAATPENGCLRIIPGSHRPRHLYEHATREAEDYTLNQEVKADVFDASKAIDVVLDPGYVSIHDVYLIHGSGPNRSPRRRAAVTYRYMPASSYFDRNLARRQHADLGVPDLTSRPLYLVRGDDPGRNDVAA